MGKLTWQEAEAVYRILVTEAGARNNPDDEHSFARYLSDTRDAEWRFMGRLGFGGKLYFDGFEPPYVGCYPEDRTPARDAIISATNERLSKWYAGRRLLAAEESREPSPTEGERNG
jgi:hypothetical protein